MGKIFIPLETLVGPANTSLKSNAAGCASSSCGSSENASSLDPEIWEKVKDHPCYSEEAHHFFARMHVAVAPACNIQCNYCNRKYDCANESRPGVVSERLTPEQGARKALAVAQSVPQLSVLGIAGPGDAVYDWRHTKPTLDAVAKALPELKLCLSTNGLALPDHVDELLQLNIDHVTVTINMVDPAIGAKIYPWIYYRNKRYYGVEASQILHERQMLGLEMLAARKVLVKVNSVMIPGVNDEHLIDVNREVKARGAFLHNIMPLISDPAHGTFYGLNGQRGPTPRELKELQDKCEGGAKLMRHCRQCRADAVGMLGEDRGQEFTTDLLPDLTEFDPTARDEYRVFVEKERAGRDKAREDGRIALQKTEMEKPFVVAVATKGQGRINEHFGHAKEFQIYEADRAGVRFSGHRKLEENYCQGGFGEELVLSSVVSVLEGVDAVLCAKIGDCPKGELTAAGIEATDDYAFEFIEPSIADLYAKTHMEANTA